MWLFVGLGNPGSEYERNRHNIGFMAVDEMASVYGFSGFKKKYQGEYCEGVIAGEKVILLKPTLFGYWFRITQSHAHSVRFGLGCHSRRR